MTRIIYLLSISLIFMACGAQQNPNSESRPIDAVSFLGEMESQIFATVPLKTTLKAFCKDGEVYSAISDKGEISLSIPSNLSCYLISEHKPLDSNRLFRTKLALLIEGKSSIDFKVISEKLVLELINLAMSEEEIIDANSDQVVDNILTLTIETGEASMVVSGE